MDLSKIKNLRKNKGLSQQDLGNLLGVSGAYIQQIENNKKNPSMKTLDKIAKVLDITTWDLIMDWERLKKDTDEIELIKKLLNHYDYNIELIQINEEEYDVEITSKESNESKILSKMEYQEFTDKLKHFIDFEFYCMKK